MAKKKEKVSGQPNREELMQMAIHAAKTGQRNGAKMMFQKILVEDKRNERAMMWMAKLSKSKKERRKWLERALVVNPENETAEMALDQMEYQEAADRNRALYRIGVVGGGVAVLVVALFLIFTTLAQPI